MGTIVLKTAKRSTSVPRLTIRKAVEAVYAGTIAAPAVKKVSPVVNLTKKNTSKKAS
jgi:hypothetical protein